MSERVLDQAPDGPFLAARRRYAQRLAAPGSEQPPVLLRAAAFRKHVPAGTRQFELLGRPGLSLVNIESLMTRVIFWTGDRWVLQHGSGLDLWATLCARADSIVEVGANVGYYTVVGGRTARGAYVAYEPHPRSCAALRSNLALNDLRRVQVVEAAVVADPALSEVDLVCPAGADEWAPTGAMVKGSVLEGMEPGRATETFVVTTALFADVVGECDLIKIDVEGLEAPLLSSAGRQLRASKPAVMVEIHDQNRELRAVIPGLLDSLEATAYAMHGNHVEPVDAEVVRHGSLFATYRTWDFLIVPAVRASLVDCLVRTEPDGRR